MQGPFEQRLVGSPRASYAAVRSELRVHGPCSGSAFVLVVENEYVWGRDMGKSTKADFPLPLCIAPEFG